MSVPSAWQRELDTTGSVRLSVSRRKVLIPFGIAFLIFAGLYSTELASGETPADEFVFVLIMSALFMLAMVWIILRLSGGKKEVVIERDAITLQNGTVIPWEEVEEVDLYRNARGPDSVRLQVTEPAWQRFLGNTGFVMRGMNHLNQVLTRKRGIYLPGSIGGDGKQMVAWLQETFVRPRADHRPENW